MEIDKTYLNLPWENAYPFKVSIDVEWPANLNYEGREYYKLGTETTREDGCPSVEYICNYRFRLWLDLDGNIRDAVEL